MTAVPVSCYILPLVLKTNVFVLSHMNATLIVYCIHFDKVSQQYVFTRWHSFCSIVAVSWLNALRTFCYRDFHILIDVFTLFYFQLPSSFAVPTSSWRWKHSQRHAIRILQLLLFSSSAWHVQLYLTRGCSGRILIFNETIFRS